MMRYALAYGQALRYHYGKRVTQCQIHTGRFLRSRSVSSDSRALPKIAQPSIWQSIVPRVLHNRSEKALETGQKKTTNPATYFIWIYLLIGSQAIRILQLQNEFNTFTRRAELKIGKLREVVEALQKGEDIDVERTLGTGDEVQEREWEEALREIEDEDRVWQTNKQKRREAKDRAIEEAAREATKDTASPVNNAVDQRAGVEDEAPGGQDGKPRPPGFY